MTNNIIRQAINSNLSQVCVTQGDVNQIMTRITEGEKVKKKPSVGLLLTIVLILLAVGTAAAVVLSMRQIVEEQAIPMAHQYEGESFTVEDTNVLLTLAEENGIELSQPAKAQIQKALDQGEGYFKEEMLMALAKAEFGESPAGWTLEQQKWFDDVCVAIGFIAEPEKAMPAGGENAKLPIIRVASDYIHQTYAVDAPLEDPLKYEIGVQYINGGEYDEYKGLYWSVDYSPLYLEGAKYWVYLRDDGTVLGDVMRPGLNDTSSVSDVWDIYRRIFGAGHTWNQNILNAFREDAMKATDTDSRAYLCLAQTTYPDIPENAISKEQAHAIAAQHVGYDERLSRSQMFFIGDTPNPVWKVRIIQDVDQWSLEIDGITGEVKNARLLDDLHGRSWMRMVLWKTVDKVDEVWVDNSPPAVG